MIRHISNTNEVDQTTVDEQGTKTRQLHSVQGKRRNAHRHTHTHAHRHAHTHADTHAHTRTPGLEERGGRAGLVLYVEPMTRHSHTFREDDGGFSTYGDRAGEEERGSQGE